MCGICGEIAFSSAAPAMATVEAMSQEMARRGPDAHGVISRDGVTLAHRRLKIIDLSDAASQPMVDSDLGLSLEDIGAADDVVPDFRRKPAARGRPQSTDRGRQLAQRCGGGGRASRIHRA